jgi:microcystin-dependent protein
MSNPFVAEIRIFPFNFAPKGWAFCDGQLLPLSQNTALFSLLGTTYGGDGKSNFALPNMQGNAPMHPGQGPGLSLHDLGEMSGTETITLLESEIPPHSHSLAASPNQASAANPTSNTLAKGFWDTGQGQTGAVNLYSTQPPTVTLSGNAIGPAGGNQPHNNLMPYLTLNFCIALQGVFPARP